MMCESWDLQEWNISFAGCGFRSIYYLGALSCILQHVPQLVHGASRICGASSGCLVAAALTVGIPIEQLCVDVLSLAKEARRHALGVFHPTFSLLREVRGSLLERLPADAHLRASGKLCVSLTRLADGRNVLVSQFDSREELVQALMCSCFFPVYCGFVPPSYRGVHYMDGALSNNMPLSEQRNTITVAPFSGESDICPREGTFNFIEVHYGNVSIQVNAGNVHRKLAEICHNGYKDALRFLGDRDLLGAQRVPSGLGSTTDEPCCEPAESTPAGESLRSRRTLARGRNAHLVGDHWWMDPRVVQNLPVGFKKVLCEACRGSHDHDGALMQLLPVKGLHLLMHLLTLVLLPVELTLFIVKRLCSDLQNAAADRRPQQADM